MRRQRGDTCYGRGRREVALVHPARPALGPSFTRTKMAPPSTSASNLSRVRPRDDRHRLGERLVGPGRVLGGHRHGKLVVRGSVRKEIRRRVGARPLHDAHVAVLSFLGAEAVGAAPVPALGVRNDESAANHATAPTTRNAMTTSGAREAATGLAARAGRTFRSPTLGARGSCVGHGVAAVRTRDERHRLRDASRSA